MTILVIAEHDGQALKNATYHTVTAALELGSDIDIVVIGQQCQEISKQAALIQGIKRVLVADASDYAQQLAENSAALVVEIARNYTHILIPATTFGKNLLPRVAALMDMAMVSDVIKIISTNTYVRPIYAGNALAMVEAEDVIQFLSIRGTAFKATSTHKQAAPIEALHKPAIPNVLSTLVSQVLQVSKRPELTSAKIIIAGGRGLKSAENFKLLEALADRLNAALGASRAAVDAGFAPNDYQVGQTGKVVAPDLYIAVGISGAIQHLAGMKESKIIVAINNDPDAPIFQVADYGLVSDLFVALKELQVELEN